jgi:hypothetical protein
MKRFGLAAMMLSVVLGSMMIYFVRVGMDLHPRGFLAVDIATVIGTTVAADIAVCWMATVLIRRRHAAMCRRRKLGVHGGTKSGHTPLEYRAGGPC